MKTKKQSFRENTQECLDWKDVLVIAHNEDETACISMNGDITKIANSILASILSAKDKINNEGKTSTYMYYILKEVICNLMAVDTEIRDDIAKSIFQVLSPEFGNAEFININPQQLN